MSTWCKLRSTQPPSGSSRDDEQGFDEIWPPAYKLNRDRSGLIWGGLNNLEGPPSWPCSERSGSASGSRLACTWAWVRRDLGHLGVQVAARRGHGMGMSLVAWGETWQQGSTRLARRNAAELRRFVRPGRDRGRWRSRSGPSVTDLGEGRDVDDDCSREGVRTRVARARSDRAAPI